MTSSSVKQWHVLMVGEVGYKDDFTDWLGEHASVNRVHTLSEVFSVLHTEPFDLIITRPSDLLSLQNVEATQQASAILNNIAQGVCIVGEGGAVEWANPKLLEFPVEVRNRASRCCKEFFRDCAATGDTTAPLIRSRRWSFTTEDREHYEITTTPIVDQRDRVSKLAVVVWNTTTTRRLQEKIDAIDDAGRELLSFDIEQFSRLDPDERLGLLETKILKCSRDLLQFDHFEVWVLDKRSDALSLVLGHDLPSGCDAPELFATNDGNGICGCVAARGRSYLCADVSKDSRYLPGLPNAQSSLTVPLMFHDRVVGVANFEVTKLAAFSEDDRQLAEIFGRYIALSLHLLEMLVSERRTTTGQIGTSVMAEIRAPLNDILTDVENLIEDYIGHDELRHRLHALSENVVRIRETIRAVTSDEQCMMVASSTPDTPKDPILDGKRVLIADDEEIIRETVRDVLAGLGCRVTATADGQAAVEMLGEHQFDLVVSDIKMPVKNGYEVFAAAKDANPNTPVILMTGFGYDPNHAIVRARREGLAAVLFKPFKVDQLLHEVRAALCNAES